MADVMMHFDEKTLCPFMSKEEMKTKAPYIFADKPTNGSVSERYTLASTETLIDDMAKLGWGVTECKQQRANKRSNVRSFHMCCFQNPNVYIEGEDGTIEAYPRVIITNSHDGFHSFKFMIGLYRLVCSNGLVLATQEFANVSIRHINYDFEELRRIVAQAIEATRKNVEVMNAMQETELTEEQKVEFATKAVAIRKGIKEDEKMPKLSENEVKEILEPVRKEDEGNNLWSVFNVIQEKIMKGDFHLGKTKLGKNRKARPITGAAKDIEVNQKLFETASSYLLAA